MDLDSLNREFCERPRRFHHITMTFSGKSHDDVGADMNSPFCRSVYGIQELRRRMAAVQCPKRPVMDGLKTVFHPDMMVLPVRFQQIDNGVWNAIRSGADGKTEDVFPGQGFVVNCPKMIDRRVGVGEGLKISNEFSGAPDFHVVRLADFDLPRHGGEGPPLTKF